MTTEQRQALEALAEWQDDTDDIMYEAEQDMSPDVDEILRGEQRVDIGIIEDLAHEIMGDFWQPTTDTFIASALVQHGVIPCSPISPSVAVTVDALELYRRILRRTLGIDDNDSGESSELPTTQHVQGDRYLSQEYINQWKKAGIVDSEATLNADSLENPCAARWNNMDDEKTKRAWGVYDETGIFAAVCRHGFCLLIADMVQSGELAKYPLAVVSKLLDTFGDGLGGGYDIGCQFRTTLNNSPLGPRARSLHYTSLVGAFHGHAHRRLCQLDHLARYVPGLGLEDLETCERTFSKSNALAPTTRYTSIFHRQQAIASYFEYNDEYEVYANLSDFLYNNYKQALDIISDSHVTLPKLMHDLNLTHESIFEDWLTEEKTYLQGLRTEPEDETLQMEYFQRLINLENYEKDLRFVQELECKLSITHRWTPEDPDWQSAGCLVANRKYQRALDTLEGLVVARIFELTKMNRSGTGYKMRKHIAKALQARSAAIKTALNRYNTAARALSPPRQSLKWEEVVEYAFLADFDLLRDSRNDVSQHPWASPSTRQATDLYFKTCRAREEITRLNVEAEVLYPVLAHQINLRRRVRSRFNSRHLQRLQDIATLPGFSGILAPGVCTSNDAGDSSSTPNITIPAQLTHALSSSGTSTNDPSAHSISAPEAEEDFEEEEEDVSNMEEASEVLDEVLRIATDS
ncbi:hypothetical protein EDD22DRAFT_1011782 [Suillus occidentalis]|nr:hypothetical protein EDD22DRAFT_1014873 [Suillus occidentalis]KAG1733685.1 hypothetical protein EDD22DRAFT_1011782 [Suillus occidentalis]